MQRAASRSQTLKGASVVEAKKATCACSERMYDEQTCVASSLVGAACLTSSLRRFVVSRRANDARDARDAPHKRQTMHVEQRRVDAAVKVGKERRQHLVGATHQIVERCADTRASAAIERNGGGGGGGTALHGRIGRWRRGASRRDVDERRGVGRRRRQHAAQHNADAARSDQWPPHSAAPRACLVCSCSSAPNTRALRLAPLDALPPLVVAAVVGAPPPLATVGAVAPPLAAPPSGATRCAAGERSTSASADEAKQRKARATPLADCAPRAVSEPATTTKRQRQTQLRRPARA